jgi:sulfatase maturation enzyme AslB (radical SAM superfamily)
MFNCSEALTRALNVELPIVHLAHLDDLWFQVAGTTCNLTCTHCFISCSPHNHEFGFLDLATVERYLEESVALGVKEYYFTGGEPFLNRDMVAILETTLRYGPATVLTNGTVFRPEWLARLRQAEDASTYSLEFRTSLDGFTAAENDPIRGEGTFDRIVRGVRLLLEYSFLPILTVTRTRDEQDDGALFDGFVQLLKSIGYDRPRVKILPALRIGAEALRLRGYQDEERVTAEMLAGFDASQLVCNRARMVTDRGVFVCPILIETPEARLGSRLVAAEQPFAIRHAACFTCYQFGSLCSNPSSAKQTP